jgi:hypothetical protein
VKCTFGKNAEFLNVEAGGVNKYPLCFKQLMQVSLKGIKKEVSGNCSSHFKSTSTNYWFETY